MNNSKEKSFDLSKVDGGKWLLIVLIVIGLSLGAGYVIADDDASVTTPVPEGEEVIEVANPPEEPGLLDKISNWFDDEANVDKAEAEVSRVTTEYESLKAAHKAEIESLTKAHESEVLRNLEAHSKKQSALELKLKSVRFEQKGSAEIVGKFCKEYFKDLTTD